jgi:hypothetical protein
MLPRAGQPLCTQLRQAHKPAAGVGILSRKVVVYGLLDVTRTDVLGRVVLVYANEGTVTDLFWPVVFLTV